MTDFGVPRRDDPEHGQHVEEDRPVVDEPVDESDPDRTATPEPAPGRQLPPR